MGNDEKKDEQDNFYKPSGILKRLADKWNWSNRQRGLINLLFDVTGIIIMAIIVIHATKCTCVDTTIPITVFNDCYVECMAEMNNNNFCVRKCLTTNRTAVNVTEYFNSST